MHSKQRQFSVRLITSLVFMVMPWSQPSHAQDTTLESGASPQVESIDWQWTTPAPVVLPRDLPGISTYSIKDPSVVRYNGQWHLFCTVRGKERSHAVVYLRFDDWQSANKAPRHVLPNHAGFFCAPQVFYYTPHKRWYMICQASDPSWQPEYQAAYATSGDIADPKRWTPLAPLGLPRTPDGKAGLDFWVICDDDHAHLFFSTLDGRKWRSQTPRDMFPAGWSQPQVALKGDVFEASHTYRIAGEKPRYLTIIEAQHGHGWRYYKAYDADDLAGKWQPVAATKEDAFASLKNVTQTAGNWTDNISHAELLRTNYDETPTVDLRDLRLLFQGVTKEDRERATNYGAIPWRLGIATQQSNSTVNPPGASK